MPIIAALVLVSCLVLTWLILRGRRSRQDREYEPPVEVQEVVERVREWVRRPSTVVAGAVIVALVLIAALARNPSRWAVMLLALGVLTAATACYVVAARRRRG